MLCAIAKLDDAATDKLNALMNKANAEVGVFRHIYGHITVATYIGNEDSDFIAYCKEQMKVVSPFEVLYHKVEVLDRSSILVATPKKNAALTYLHNQINERYSHALDGWTKGDAWYPHTTLLHSPDADLGRICCMVSQDFIPFPAFIRRIEFSRVFKNGYEIIDHIDFLVSERHAPLAHRFTPGAAKSSTV